MNAHTSDTYMDRNGRWLRFFLGALILLVGPLLIQSLGQPVPSWLIAICVGFGVYAIGFGSFLLQRSETLSASIARVVLGALAIGAAIHFAMKYILGIY